MCLFLDTLHAAVKVAAESIHYHNRLAQRVAPQATESEAVGDAKLAEGAAERGVKRYVAAAKADRNCGMKPVYREVL